METRNITALLQVGSRRRRVQVPERMRLADLARLCLKIDGALTVEAARASRRAGSRISCRKGCGACCRQVVPVSPPEAWMLADLVSSMPEPRRHLMRRRFAATGTAIDAHFPRHAPLTGLADEYFALGIACPFLEDEACSIHPDRPSICREYMVTTPAERCNSLNSPYAGIEFVPLPLRISEGLAQVAAIAMETAPMSIALTSALAWARENSVDGRRTWDSRILLAWTEAAFARSATG